MTSSELRRIDARPLPSARGEIRATLIVRDEEFRLPHVLDHHRAMGVDRFFVVDNGSSDGTLDLLLAQPDTHVWFTTGPFKEEKASWRRHLLEEHCEGVWTLNLDADELFLYPGMETIDLHRFCEFLEAEGAKGLFSALVDMYPDAPLGRTTPEPGYSLLDLCPCFDATGYLLRYRGSKKRVVSPWFRLEGGPRERVFFRQPRRSGIRSAFASWLFDIRRTTPHPLTRLPGLGAVASSVARSAFPEYLPDMGKVPLLRWSSADGIREHLCALHTLSPRIPLSRCWGALLHFKYLSDFRERVAEAVEQKLYGAADDEYERYGEVLDETPDLDFSWEDSRHFESTQSLLEAGLMRTSDELIEFLATHPADPVGARAPASTTPGLHAHPAPQS